MRILLILSLIVMMGTSVYLFREYNKWSREATYCGEVLFKRSHNNVEVIVVQFDKFHKEMRVGLYEFITLSVGDRLCKKFPVWEAKQEPSTNLVVFNLVGGIMSGLITLLVLGFIIKEAIDEYIRG